MTNPHPHDEDPEQHIGEPVPDPWAEDDDSERTISFTPLFESLADPADNRERGFRWLG